MKPNTIVISEQDVFTNKPLTLNEVLQLTLSCIGSYTQEVRKELQNKGEQKDEELFNLLNVSFSKTLDYLFPELTGRPDLTEEAILKAENELLKKKEKGE